MKFSHAWLLDYVPLEAAPEEIGRRLTAVGVPLEGIARPDPAAPDDAVYDFDVLTNRPDCMNHVGIARELAAIYRVPLRPPSTKAPAGGPPTTGSATVDVESPALCHRYGARAVLGVRVAPSPDWLRRRLERIGQRSINNIVDATNFVLWESGQPLHPFDLARIAERRIVVREARAGEILLTLDGIERRLEAGMLVIADPRGPVALAGIMGGRASEITAATRDVLLESAWFDPVAVRRAARALGMRTDASHRFERGADPQATLAALDRAAALVAEVAGGTVTDPAIDAGPGPGPGRVVAFRPARVAALLGYDPGAGTGRRILESLGFSVEETRDLSWRVSVPSFRLDVEREADLVEEIARHAGYDAIPAALPLLDTGRTGRARSDMVVRDGRRALTQGGLHEAVNFAMADAAECLRFLPGSVPVGLENPLQSGAAALRTTLLPGLVRNASHNLNRGAAGCHLFEIGHAFLPGKGRPAEIVRAAGVLAGRAPSDHWSTGPREVDIFDAKGMVELLARMTGDLTPRFSSARIAAAGAVRGLEVEAGGKPVGVVGEIVPDILREFGVDRRVFAFEVDLEALAGPATGPTVYRSLPRHPAVRRDLALIAPERCTVDEIEALIRASSPLPIAEIEVFDRFRGAGLAKGTCSIALQLVFQHPERTLAAEEVQAAQDAIVAALAERLGLKLRGPGTA